MSAALPCHRCGYDLRAHPADGKCPECGESVAESRRVAAIPRRPDWRDSDPRWRRRMLAGAWILVFLPLMNVLSVFGWTSRVPVPNVFDFRGTVRTLDDTLLLSMGVYESLVFCIGIVLLFSKERGRRLARLDWTRRWGVICSYVVLLLCAADILFIAALVLAGIAALFQSMPPKYQPEVTQLCVDLSWIWLRYGAHPKTISYVVLIMFSSITILLACVPFFDALRSSGPKWVAVTLLAPLALFSLMHLAQIGRYFLGSSLTAFSYGLYFSPDLLVGHIANLPVGWNVARSAPGVFVVEVMKWCIVLAIAVWLSIAQLAAWRSRYRSNRGT